MKFPAPLWLAAIWIVICAYLTCAGWALSAIHMLNLVGYSLAVYLGLLLTWLGMPTRKIPMARWRLFKLFWRTRRWVPAIYYLVTSLAFIGGALYAPNNYDALTYRLPRILHWLAEGQWHWISAGDQRINYSGTGFEWLMVPLFVFFKTDRLFFLINWISQLLLPGLAYSAFIRLGVRRRVAWYWMWLIPCGYLFVLQAGSIGNDTFAVPFFLGSLVFFLLARHTGSLAHWGIGAIAAGLLTGAKACNLPLLLPCLLAALPATRFVRTKPLQLLAILLVAFGASFGPLALLNARHAGTWTGKSKTNNMKIDHPGYGLLGNALQLAVQNIAPPVSPFAKKWNAQIAKLETKAFFPQLLKYFPRLMLTWNDLAQEEGAGLGMGLTMLISATFFGLIFTMRPSLPILKTHPGSFWPGANWAIVCSGAIALLVYMAKLASESAARLVAAFYPIVLACFLILAANEKIVRQKWWKYAAVLAALTALPCVILTPSRPLFPANTFFAWLASSYPKSELIARARQVYQVYGRRANNLAPICNHLPKGVKLIGFVGHDDSEVSLWRPFGTREVRILHETSHPDPSVRLLVCSEDAIQGEFREPFQVWTNKQKAKILASERFATKVSRGPQDWYVVELPQGWLGDNSATTPSK